MNLSIPPETLPYSVSNGLNFGTLFIIKIYLISQVLYDELSDYQYDGVCPGQMSMSGGTSGKGSDNAHINAILRITIAQK